MGVFTDAAPGMALLCRIKVALRPHARMGATFFHPPHGIFTLFRGPL